MTLAVNEVPTSKMLFLIGEGGDGKSMDAILERNVLGENNCTTLDCGVFTDRQELRKSAHFGLNKLSIRVQEFTSQ